MFFIKSTFPSPEQILKQCFKICSGEGLHCETHADIKSNDVPFPCGEGAVMCANKNGEFKSLSKAPPRYLYISIS